MALTLKQRTARREFLELYGPLQRNVVTHIAKGWDSLQISEKLEIPIMSVAATRANVTRGTYLPFVEGNLEVGFVGICSF